MRSWYSICALNESAEILIYDEIGAYGVSAKSFLADLGALPADAPLELRLNSPGETQGARATPVKPADPEEASQ
jgi:ATP-dependent Clp protease protease subunit